MLDGNGGWHVSILIEIVLDSSNHLVFEFLEKVLDKCGDSQVYGIHSVLIFMVED